MPDTGNHSFATDEALPVIAQDTAVRLRRPPMTVMIAIAATFVLTAAGSGAMLWLRSADGDVPGAATAAAASYVDAPAMVVNMRSADGRTHFLKLRFVIVAASPAKTARITERMPVVVDALQSFLRELRPEDLNGSAAIFRVKEEMMIRTQAALGKGNVSDILIQDLVEQ